MSTSDPHHRPVESIPYMGMSPFLRLSIEGGDLNALGGNLLTALAKDPHNADLLMNMSILSQCLAQPEIGLEFQREALKFARIYKLPAHQQPARLRLLMLVAPGNLQVNTPLECLLETSDVDLVFYYVYEGQTSLASVPDHDAVFVAICESDNNRALLRALEVELENWPAPVINSPSFIPLTGRQTASAALQDVPKLLVPATVRATRQDLHAIATGQSTLDALPGACGFPVIVRPIASQAGKDLKKIDAPEEMADYLQGVQESVFYIAPFVDYRDAAGQYKKIRIALIDGQAFACHMAVSSSWMVHYLNAGMYEHAWKRAQEAAFMDQFDPFLRRHQPAFDAISRRMQLDYLVLDCAETATGALLLFEIDHGGVVHNMDKASLFPYKDRHMQRVQTAFRDYLVRRVQASQRNHAQ